MDPPPTPLPRSQPRIGCHGVSGPRPLLAAALLGLAGCGSTNTPRDPAMPGEGRILFGGPSQGPGEGSGARPDEPAWTIVIVAFQGADQEQAAQAGLARARTVGGLPGAYVQRQGNSTVIAYGRYADAESPDARADLRRIREMTIDGARPFAGAVLAPPDGIGTGRTPDLDLRRVRAAFGKDALYTLQIGVYGRDDRRPPQNEKERAEFVRAAEDAAAQLRREGYQAFYYHGPTMSLVTVGIFGADDFDPQRPEQRSERLRAAQQAFPNNLLNGRGINVRVRGVPGNNPGATRLASSFLIAIPEE